MNKDNDVLLLKELNKKLSSLKVKLKFEYYDIFPFDLKDRGVINEIIKYTQEMNNFTNKIYLVTSLVRSRF